MACKGSGVQIPSAPLKNMKKFVLETKELLFSQGIVAILAIVQIRIVAKTLGPESYGEIGVYLGVIALSFRFLNSRNSDLILINHKNFEKNFLVSSILFELCLGIISSLIIFLVLSLQISLNFFGIVSLPEFIYLFITSKILKNILEKINKKINSGRLAIPKKFRLIFNDKTTKIINEEMIPRHNSKKIALTRKFFSKFL